MHSQALVSAQPARVEALRSKHATIDQKIEREQRRSYRNDLYIRKLKLKRLKLKEEIEGISKVSE